MPAGHPTSAGWALAHATLIGATRVEEEHQLSFWDALILEAARVGGAELLLTEDLQHGRMIEGVRIENPFEASERSSRWR